ncbi:BnaC05g46640D [Brassica napus]|uniref:BnaC05g46640D protein n=1 Tax=Brassica napus TaxID=3708 RepID=A0A078HTR0_BRANA|nr:BnaC05g46640D [Brassica napus]
MLQHSNTAEVRLLRFWEARNINKGGELMSLDMLLINENMKSKACEASKFVSKHGTTYYKQFLEKNRQYIQEPATVEKCQELSKQLPYTHLARSFS